MSHRRSPRPVSTESPQEVLGVAHVEAARAVAGRLDRLHDRGASGGRAGKEPIGIWLVDVQRLVVVAPLGGIPRRLLDEYGSLAELHLDVHERAVRAADLERRSEAERVRQPRDRGAEVAIADADEEV